MSSPELVVTISPVMVSNLFFSYKEFFFLLVKLTVLCSCRDVISLCLESVNLFPTSRFNSKAVLYHISS